MANTKNKESMAYKNKVAYIKKHNKTLKRFYVSVNPTTEGDIIEWLKGRKNATYIKHLIREDMKKQGN